MKHVAALRSRVGAFAGSRPRLKLPGIERLARLSVDKKAGLVAAVGLTSLILVGGLASHVVATVKRQSDATDRTHAVLIELTAITAHIAHMERLERDLTLDTAARIGAYVEANQNAARSVAALEQLLPLDSPRRVVLRDMSRLIERQRARLLAQEPATGREVAAPWQPPAARSIASDVEAIEDLADHMWQSENSELERSKTVEQEGFRRIGAGAMIIGIVGSLPGLLLLFLLRHDAIMQRRAAASLAAPGARPRDGRRTR
jgi:hypothetical protein